MNGRSVTCAYAFCESGRFSARFNRSIFAGQCPAEILQPQCNRPRPQCKCMVLPYYLYYKRRASIVSTCPVPERLLETGRLLETERLFFQTPFSNIEFKLPRLHAIHNPTNQYQYMSVMSHTHTFKQDV